MEHWYERWGAKWIADGNKDINNPKIPLAYVRKYGSLLYSSVGKNMEDTLPAASRKPSSKTK